MNIEPFKIVGQLVACSKDDDGNIIGEEKVADVVLYASQFDELAAKVDETMKLVRQQIGAQANGKAPAA